VEWGSAAAPPQHILGPGVCAGALGLHFLANSRLKKQVLAMVGWVCVLGFYLLRGVGKWVLFWGLVVVGAGDGACWLLVHCVHALPRHTGGNLLSSTTVVCAPAGGTSEGPGVPSQLETLLPGHRKGHPSRLVMRLGPAPTVKLLMLLVSNGGRDNHVAASAPAAEPAGPYGSLCTSSGRVARVFVPACCVRGDSFFFNGGGFLLAFLERA
jgi:hypothetical protein